MPPGTETGKIFILWRWPRGGYSSRSADKRVREMPNTISQTGIERLMGQGATVFVLKLTPEGALVVERQEEKNGQNR